MFQGDWSESKQGAHGIPYHYTPCPEKITQTEIKCKQDIFFTILFHQCIKKKMSCKRLRCTKSEAFQCWNTEEARSVQLNPNKSHTCSGILSPHDFVNCSAATPDCSVSILLEAQRWFSQQLGCESRCCDLSQFGSLDKLAAHF